MVELPLEIPLFPLERCILIPGCNLPLQVFEPRYLQMFEDLDPEHRFIGIVQPKNDLEQTHQELFTVGTVGEVIEVKNLPNRRYGLVLKGMRRFSILDEIASDALYRKAHVSYESYLADPSTKDVALIRDDFFLLLDQYVRQKKIKVKVNNMKDVRNFQIINILSQVLPFTLVEKQSLLEMDSHHDRMEQLITLMKMETARNGRLTMDDKNPVMN